MMTKTATTTATTVRPNCRLSKRSEELEGGSGRRASGSRDADLTAVDDFTGSVDLGAIMRNIGRLRGATGMP